MSWARATLGPSALRCPTGPDLFAEVLQFLAWREELAQALSRLSQSLVALVEPLVAPPSLSPVGKLIVNVLAFSFPTFHREPGSGARGDPTARLGTWPNPEAVALGTPSAVPCGCAFERFLQPVPCGCVRGSSLVVHDSVGLDLIPIARFGPAGTGSVHARSR